MFKTCLAERKRKTFWLTVILCMWLPLLFLCSSCVAKTEKETTYLNNLNNKDVSASINMNDLYESEKYFIDVFRMVYGDNFEFTSDVRLLYVSDFALYVSDDVATNPPCLFIIFHKNGQYETRAYIPERSIRPEAIENWSWLCEDIFAANLESLTSFEMGSCPYLESERFKELVADKFKYDNQSSEVDNDEFRSYFSLQCLYAEIIIQARFILEDPYSESFSFMSKRIQVINSVLTGRYER